MKASLCLVAICGLLSACMTGHPVDRIRVPKQSNYVIHTPFPGKTKVVEPEIEALKPLPPPTHSVATMAKP